MVLLPSTATLKLNTNTSNPADLFTRPLTTRRFKSRIPLSLSLSTTVTATAVAPQGVTAPVVSTSATTLYHSDSVVLSTGLILDTGASFSLTPFKSDFDFGTPTSELLLLLHKRLFGIPRSALDSLLGIDPYTLLTGEDTVDTVELSPPDYSEFAYDFASELTRGSRRFETKYFGTAILIFKYSNSDLKLFVEPDLYLEDWLHWTPIPRLTLRDSYFQVVPGTTLDYIQVFGLLHLIPIWFYLALLCFE